MPNQVIITAGGLGQRTGQKLPKQFHTLAGIPVLAHSINTFSYSLPGAPISVTLPREWQDYWQKESQKIEGLPSFNLVDAGESRFDSIKNALASIEDDSGYVWIHDAARPMVSHELIHSIESQLGGTSKGFIPAISMRDSLRKWEDQQWKPVKRENFCLIQTPQVFPLKQLKIAYQQAYNETFSDDATVYESTGYEIELIQGEEKNLKITYSIDLAIAESLLRKA